MYEYIYVITDNRLILELLDLIIRSNITKCIGNVPLGHTIMKENCNSHALIVKSRFLGCIKCLNLLW